MCSSFWSPGHWFCFDIVVAISLYYTEITIIMMKYKGEIFVEQIFLVVWYLYVYIYIILAISDLFLQLTGLNKYSHTIYVCTSIL